LFSTKLEDRVFVLVLILGYSLKIFGTLCSPVTRRCISINPLNAVVRQLFMLSKTRTAYLLTVVPRCLLLPVLLSRRKVLALVEPRGPFYQFSFLFLSLDTKSVTFSLSLWLKFMITSLDYDLTLTT